MLKAYKINFLSISSQIRAYTIFGAICWAYRLYKGEEKLKQFLNEFKENPKFLISSPYPIINYNYEGNKDKVYETYLFPKPILPLSNNNKRRKPEDKSFELICKKKGRKNYKKAKYITEDVFKDFIEGKIKEEAEFVEDDIYMVYKKKIIYKSNKCIEFHPEAKSDLLTKNVINRVTSTSNNLYTEEGMFFTNQYFLVKFFDISFIKEFEALLRIIEELGIGKNKNIGWGRIKIEEINDLKWLEEHIDNSYRFITLSPLIPTRNIDIQNSFYEFETYKAPVENSFSKYLLKKKVLYIKEGSVLQSNEKGFKGKLEQVVKDHEIYQYGLEFPIKVNSNEEK